MTLKLRASSQVKSVSVGLSNLANVSSGTILGRSEDESGSGSLSAISGADVRKIAELHNDDNVQFASASLSGSLTAASATLSGDLAAADANLSGDLNATGDVGGATATITGNSTIGGTLSVSSSLSADSADISNALTAASATLSGNLSAVDANLSGDLNATGDVGGATATVSGNATVGGTLDASGAFTAASTTLSGAMSSSSISTTSNASIGGDMTVTGNLLIEGDSVQVNVGTLEIEDSMIKFGNGNSSDLLDLGFYGLYNDGSDKYAGLFRDQNDSGKFKLFDGITSEPENTVADVSSNKATLVADIEGNITFENARTFSLSGDIVGSATFSGDDSPNISSTIQEDAVELSMIDFFLDDDNMSSDSAVHVASQQSIKAYIATKVASGGQSDLEAKDMLMVDSSGEYVKVKEITEYSLVDSDDESNDYVTVSTEIESEFKELSKIYLNGQKLRYSSDTGTNNDYWFTESGSSATLHATTLTASDQSASDIYTAQGISMSDDGTVLAVGSQLWDRAGGGSNHGGVYVYDWTDTDDDGIADSWVQRGDVFSPPSDATSGVSWGHSVSLSSDGSYLAVGSIFHTETVSQQGGVFVYEWDDSTSSWDSHGSVAVTTIDPGFGDRHIMPSLSGDASVLAVGAFSWDGASKTNDGKVYIYDWDSTDQEWDQRTTINASDAGSYDYFGIDVSLSNDASILAVGASSWDGDTANQGGVYIYDWTDTNSDGNPDTFVQRGDVIESNNPSVNAYFGYGVELNNAGTTLIVGSNGAGKAEIFNWNSTTSSWDHAVTVSDPVSGGVNFGGSVAINSDATKFVVGSYGNGSTIAGRAHTYDLSSSSTNKINFNDGVISENDKLEISYIIKS